MAAQVVETGLGAHVDLVMAAGATNRWRLQLGNEDRTVTPATWTPVDLTGWTGRAQLRRSTSSATAWSTLTTSTGGITLTADGTCTITLTAAATDGDEWQDRSGMWDVELTDPAGEVIRLGYGRFECRAQVTR